MIKRFVFLSLEFIVGIAGNLIAGWIQQDQWHNFFTTQRMVASCTGVILILILLTWLESGRTFFLTIHWHRFWYLTELLNQEIKYVPLGYKVKSEGNFSINPIEMAGFNNHNKDIVTELLATLSEQKEGIRLLVLGDTGIGKTTILKKLSQEVARVAIRSMGIKRQIPIIIRLGNYSGEKLLNYIRDCLTNQGVHGQVMAKMLLPQLEKGTVQLFFDAVDEATGIQSRIINEELAEIVNNQRFKKTPVIITSRIQGGDDFRFSNIPSLEVQELGDDGVDDFIELYRQQNTSVSDIKKWLNSHDMLEQRGIGRNPLWLYLVIMADMVQFYDLSIMDDRNSGKFFNKSIDNLLKREYDTKKKAARLWNRILPREEQIKKTKDALAYLAYEMGHRGIYSSIDEKFALDLLSKWLMSQVGLEKLRPQDLLFFGIDAKLISFETGYIRFQHRLLQESMMAWNILNRWGFIDDEQISLISSDLLLFVIDKAWWEPLILLSDILCEQQYMKMFKNLIVILLDDNDDERRLILAAGLLQCDLGENTGLLEEVISALEKLLRRGATSTIKQAVLDLATVLNGNKLEFLKRLISKSNEPPIAVFDILAILKNEFSINLLILQLQSKTLYENAIQALVTIGSLAVAPLLQVLNDNPMEYRIPIIKCLGLIGDSRAIHPLVELLKNENIYIRASSSKALQQIGDEAIIEVSNLLHDEDIIIVATAAETLRQMSEKVVDCLAPNLFSSKIKLQVASAWVLWHLGISAAKPLSNMLDRFNLKTYGRTYTDNPQMRVLGAMIPVYRRSPELVKKTQKELSSKASDLVGRVLMKRNFSEIHRWMLAEYMIRHRKDETTGTVMALYEYISVYEKDEKSNMDQAIYEYASLPALKLAYDITYQSNQLIAAHSYLESKHGL